jgi:hypothetical protein
MLGRIEPSKDMPVRTASAIDDQRTPQKEIAEILANAAAVPENKTR